MTIKFVSPENLEYFKGKQDDYNDSKFAAKENTPTNESMTSAIDLAISNAVSSVFTFKGTVDTFTELPSLDQKVGDVYSVNDTGAEYVWSGTEWEELGRPLNLTWESISGKPSVFTPASHTHTKSEITNFPESLPASDVSEWAKAPTKPTYTHTEVGAAASVHAHNTFTTNTAGFVPGPTSEQADSFLRGDGQWAAIPTPDTMEPMTTQEIDALF